jgi:hypothetical protein
VPPKETPLVPLDDELVLVLELAEPVGAVPLVPVVPAAECVVMRMNIFL